MKMMYQNLSTSLNKIMRCNGLARSVWSQNAKRHESKKKIVIKGWVTGEKKDESGTRGYGMVPELFFFQLLDRLKSQSSNRLLRRSSNRECRYDGH